ncbi:MAG: TetR/AcrR family transcriptional regulator [Hyphomicrobiales bacterium]
MTLETTANPSERPPGRLERRKARTRAAILDAAAHLFQQQGFEETSIQQIAEQADTGVGTVYGYFASKDDILGEVLRVHSEDAVERYKAAVDSHTPSFQRIAVALDFLADYIKGNRTILLAAVQSSARARPLEEHGTEWLFASFRSLLQQGMDRGELRKLPVDSTVRTLLSTYSMAMLGIGPWAGHEDDPATVTDLEQVVRALLLPA